MIIDGIRVAVESTPVIGVAIHERLIFSDKPPICSGSSVLVPAINSRSCVNSDAILSLAVLLINSGSLPTKPRIAVSTVLTISSTLLN